MRTYAAILVLLCPGSPWAVDDPTTQAIHRAACKWRTQYGMTHQRLDEHCCVLAQQHADYMARHEWYEHGRHDQVINRGSRSSAACVSSWIYSAPHREWMLSGHRQCGWGHAVSRSGTHYWVGVFRSN